MMLIGNLALTGVGIPILHVGLAGFYSKDAIIDAAYSAHTGIGTYAFILTLLAAGDDLVLFLAPVPDDVPRPLSRPGSRCSVGHSDAHAEPKMRRRRIITRQICPRSTNRRW